MGVVLFVVSLAVFAVGLDLHREGHRPDAATAFVSAAVLLSGAFITGAINGLTREFAQRFPRTGVEKMVAAYREQGGE